MHAKRLLLILGSLLLGLSLAATVHAQPRLLMSGGGQLQIGGGLPLPVQTVPTTGGPAMSPVTMGTVFPSLLIPPILPVVIGQTSGPDPQKMTFPANVLSRPAAPVATGVFGQNPALFEVRTSLTFTWPVAAGAMFSAGGRTGGANTTLAGPGGGTITYTAGPAQFGGPAQFALGLGNLPPDLLPASPVTVIAIAASPPPCVHPFFAGTDAGCLGALVVANPNMTAAAGAPIGFTNMTTPLPPVPGIFLLSAPNTMGTVNTLVPTPAMTMAGLVNTPTSGGFPWTTGMLTITAPAAGAPEIFMLTGMDSRVGGAGNIQLVAGALSARALSGPNANRGWLSLTLPEPGIALGSLAALGMLVTCHGLVRRRSR